jgi:hypothetical protein
LWSVVLLHLPPGERCALLVLLHHVVADGVGGLTVLAHLVDPGGEAAGVDFPRPRPHTAVLLADALVTKARAVTRVPRSWRSLRSSMAAGGGFRPGPVAPCSLMRQTGPRRRMAVVRTGYDALRAAAHRQGATTNDALLVAVAGALGQVLETRGEHLDSVIVTVPVSGRRTDHQRLLGNLVSPMLVPVPTTGARSQRLADVAETVRARRSAATGPAPIAVLGWLFRPMAALGGYRWYMNHQHRFHTLVSHVRGPAEPLAFGGRRITDVVPVGVAESGNATVSFEALSYAGALSVTAIVDPDRFPDTDVLAQALEDELRALGSPAAPGVTPVVRSRGGARPSTPRPRAGRPASP